MLGVVNKVLDFSCTSANLASAVIFFRSGGGGLAEGL